ncbi:Signal transduction histidine kinase [Hydrobacter penzbergensis]|uniref:histidine kinase n=1 Tax=Hydrobacter penzbergensis TaxID=1235997 RepID=A0A8X8LCW3_9BACT|nr:ATP-binding protein [Hydrobacter penzbergensis]SDW51159.1 Signal transduction histidine kinase [Hydrobacter penzbergensis]
MLVFGTQMHIVTFLFVSIEIVIFFYLAIFHFARPDDKTTKLNLILIFLLLTYNITGGLLPDPKLPGSYFLQEVIAYATGFITPCYFPYYVFKAFGLTKLRFHAYKGVYLFLIFPYCIFVFIFWLTGDLKDAQNLLIIPVLYAIWVIISLSKAIRYKYNHDFSSVNARQEMIVLLFSLTPWIGLPIITYFNLGQAVEALVTNIGFLLLFGLQVNRHVTELRTEHEKLMESEQRLRSWNADLRDEVTKRTKELEKINEQRTNNFINLVHETKTPLTLIKNYLDEYISKHGAVEELDVIKGGVDKLTADVINLFDIERFSKGIDSYTHDQVSDISSILRDSLPLFQHYCVKHKIECSTIVEENILVKADPNAIFRIINNIVENAIKFTDPGGEIIISLTTLEDEVVFSVTDTGIGIPQELQKKIFEPYYQIGYKNTILQGMGLGLPIVKKVVEGLGGTIVIESNPSKSLGTKVIISLSRYEPRENDKPVKDVDGITKLNYFNYDNISDGEYEAEKRTILLVEDNIAMINFIANKLRTTYNVFCACNGSDALKKLFAMPVTPDLVLSDVMMDKMDGYAFIKTLSEQDKYSHIPIILLTAKSTPTDRLKGLRLGAIDFISKPFSFEELSQKIETILDNIVRQQKAIINTSIANLKTGKNQEADKMAQSSISTFEQNCKLLQLTARETEIVRLIMKGKTYKNIATALFISEKTVTKHIQNIFIKAEVSNKVELINKLNK